MSVVNILHIDSSILGPGSVSRRLSAGTTAKLVAINPGCAMTYRDLAAAPLPHLSGAYLAATRSAEELLDLGIRDDIAIGAAVMTEFLAADVLVIGVGFYNFGIPSQLKAWVDRILIAGQTFRYGADGRPIGLVAGKRVILVIARGGFYGAGSPIASFEYAESYLRAALGFIGITDIEVITADGIAAGPEQRANAIADAERRIDALAA